MRLEVRPFLLVLSFCEAAWKCGNVKIYADNDICDCSGVDITSEGYTRRAERCCNLSNLPQQCVNRQISKDLVSCANSKVCKRAYDCGDKQIDADKTCTCSGQPITLEDYDRKERCCTPPGKPAYSYRLS